MGITMKDLNIFMGLIFSAMIFATLTKYLDIEICGVNVFVVLAWIFFGLCYWFGLNMIRKIIRA